MNIESNGYSTEGICTYMHIVELLGVVAPHRVVEAVVLGDEADALVGVVGVLPRAALGLTITTLGKTNAPELDGNVLGAVLDVVVAVLDGADVDGGAVKLLVVDAVAGELHDGGGDVGVGGGVGALGALGDAGPADDEGHADVGLEAAHLARVQAVLADVEAVVRGVEDVGVVEQALVLEALDHLADELVDGHEGAQAQPLVLVVVLENGGVELGQVGDPVDAAGLVRVEVLRARDLVVLEEVAVACGRLGRPVGRGVLGQEAVRRHGGQRHEEGLVRLRRGVVDELLRVLGDDVGRVVALEVLGLALGPRRRHVVVLVRVGLQEEVGPRVPAHVRAVVVVDGVPVEELAGVVGVVAGILHPEAQVVVVVSILDKLWVAA